MYLKNTVILRILLADFHVVTIYTLAKSQWPLSVIGNLAI